MSGEGFSIIHATIRTGDKLPDLLKIVLYYTSQCNTACTKANGVCLNSGLFTIRQLGRYILYRVFVFL